LDEWLKSLGLSEYGRSFAENHIGFSILPDLTDQDLKELGVTSLGHRRLLLRAIAALGSDPAESVPQASAGQPPRGSEPVAATGAGRLQPDDAERRHLTMMFCDLVGSTALSADLDPEDMREVIRAYQQCCATAISAYDGYVAKYLGDGVLAYFGYPHAHEDDAERAVRAGLELVAAVGRIQTPHSALLQVRIGIASGLVVVGDLIGEGASQERAVVGDTPNHAARLQSLAEPGAIVVAASTRQLLGNIFELHDLGRHQVKGFKAPIEAWAIKGTRTWESRFEARATALTGFIGRERESELLLECKEKAWRGQGQVVVISGEAGIGKSRLSGWLSEHLASEPHIRLRYQCTPYHADSPLYPFVMQLGQAAGIKADDLPDTKLDKLEALLGTHRSEASPTVLLIAELLSIPTAGRYPKLGLSPAQQRRDTLAALLDQLDSLARQNPLLLVFEDAHWADATSRELLDLAIERGSQLRVLVVVTTRPEYVPPWIGRPYVNLLALTRLDSRDARSMVQRLTGGRTIPPEVMDQIVVKTDGIPLFVEELTKNVIESGLLVEDGDRYRLTGPLPPLAIPATLHDSLTARLGRLAPVKEIAQIGAAIGREFSYRLLLIVAAIDEAALLDALDKLEKAELVSHRGTPPDAFYTFKHALVRDTAYAGLVRSRRQVIHRDIANALCEYFSSVAGSEQEIIAYHFTEAGLKEEALEWWGKAGDLALRRSAYVEAMAHLGKALGLIEGLESGPEQRLRQLRLQIAYGQSAIHARGWAVPETTAAFARARELATGIEDPIERSAAYFGLWGGCFVRGEVASMRDVADAFLDDAEERAGSAEQSVAHRAVGESCWFVGDYVGARAHLVQAVDCYDEERDTPLAQRFTQDIGVSAMLFLSLALWPLGEVDRACRLAKDAIALAIRGGHVPTLTHAHFNACLLEGMRGDIGRSLPHAVALVDLCQERNVQSWMPGAVLMDGWVRWHLGERETGKARMREALAMFRDRGIGVYVPFVAPALAKADAQTDGPEKGLATIDQFIAESERMDQSWFASELQRERGALLLRCAPRDFDAAETALQKALAIARAQQAKTFALRAALDLARLYQTTGRSREGRELLEPALAGVAGEQELPELGEAAVLLTSLGL
jgi:class 3 adenylate cyclase/tetratricopeptide (TPR) repeat protein/ABC-type transport system involved in cytochrome c biogenesis ATPase subunit